ncbi:hypothetical protein EV127DRAFT_410558 [Xylaria flabelliformis]|nr:hypothetical protein EV127DRAFT_410558 [Xylaria flabelliformis]
MHSSRVLAAVAVASSCALAMPTKRGRADGVDWVNDENGQLVITFSDDKVNMGTVKVQDIIDILSKASLMGRSGLLETLLDALDKAVECQEVTNISDCVGSGLGAYCPEHKTTVNQCKLPKYFAVNYQADDASHAAPPFIEAKLDLEVAESGFCAKFTTIGSAIAGAVNGAAGGVFSLIGLACQ